MLRRVTLRNFKRFAEQSFDLVDAMVLAGPNNAGKSTLLQAIATWRLGLARWVALRKGGGAVKRSGAAITRNDLTTVPLREMNLLWEDRRISGGGGGPRRPIEIVLEGESDGGPWTCGLEFEYANREMIYVRPLGAKTLDREAIRAFPPQAAGELAILHVPPLSGTERDEPRRDRGMQDLLVGQGRPGEILRNLLWEIAEERSGDWDELAQHIRNLFGIELQRPAYAPAQPFIVCEYRASGRSRPLDLANAGSGSLQVLLLLAFLYARPAAVILLDEPDAHQHVILQRQVYELIRELARERGCQVLVATHSEVILDATEPTRVLGFTGANPRPLSGEIERNRLREALKRITTTELLLGEEVGAVLYVEGQSDPKILGAWAEVLQHSSRQFFRRPFFHWLGGRSLREAREHFFALRAAFPKIRGLCLLDGDNRDELKEETTRSGLVVLRWRRYEIENYLLHPKALQRFVPPLWKQQVEKAFWRQVPRGTDLFGDHVSLVRIKASEEFLAPLFAELGRPLPKRDLYQLAGQMRFQEIHPEVRDKLDRIRAILCSGAASVDT